jgi:addiction module HigA family antidote
MHNPPHPGEILKSPCLEPLGLTVTAAAKALGVSRKTPSAILNGRAGISPEMAGCRLLLILPLRVAEISRRNSIFGMLSKGARN